MNALSKSEQLKNELDDLRPLDAEAEARIMQKFRLDWNYHSNNLEGNSLTYGETKALILFGITAQGKPLKDHFEITGHNEAINWVLDVVKDKTPLTEKFIRELHTLLLKESSYKEAQTPEGKPTRRKIEVGKYKTQPNHVITVTGETFYFATPEETPAKMQELVEGFRKEKEKSDVNPIILAALFHYRFIRIHPFDDGNGRVARILMNFILMQFGYPPVIIKTEDKENYYAVLRLADADELEPFIEYIAQNLVRSLEIMIRGAKGEGIDEPEDLDKKLLLLDESIKHIGHEVRKTKNKETLLKIFDFCVNRLTNELVKSCRKFDKFYSQSYFHFFCDGISFQGHEISNAIGANTKEVGLVYFHKKFKRSGFDPFNYTSHVRFLFNPKTYIVDSSAHNIIYEKTYSEYLTDKEMKKMIDVISEKHINFIEMKKKEIENEINTKEFKKNVD